MKLLHISDLHYLVQYQKGPGLSSYQSIFPHMPSPLRQLDRCLRQMGESERDALAGVLISGDLTENGTAADYERLRRELEDRFPRIPIIVTPGNHDNRREFYQGWLGQCGNDDPYCRLVRIGPLSVLSLDNSSPEHPNGEISASLCCWIQDAAEEEKNRTILLMTHHHLLSQQAAFPACCLDSAFSEVLSKHPVAMILCGHTHQLYRGFYEGTPYRTTMSLSFVGQEQDGATCMRSSCGYSLYDFDQGQLTSERHEAIGPQSVLGYVKF